LLSLKIQLFHLSELFVPYRLRIEYTWNIEADIKGAGIQTTLF
jgi:hypothetical protein